MASCKSKGHPLQYRDMALNYMKGDCSNWSPSSGVLSKTPPSIARAQETGTPTGRRTRSSAVLSPSLMDPPAALTPSRKLRSIPGPVTSPPPAGTKTKLRSTPGPVTSPPPAGTQNKLRSTPGLVTSSPSAGTKNKLRSTPGLVTSSPSAGTKNKLRSTPGLVTSSPSAGTKNKLRSTPGLVTPAGTQNKLRSTPGLVTSSPSAGTKNKLRSTPGLVTSSPSAGAKSKSRPTPKLLTSPPLAEAKSKPCSTPGLITSSPTKSKPCSTPASPSAGAKSKARPTPKLLASPLLAASKTCSPKKVSLQITPASVRCRTRRAFTGEDVLSQLMSSPLAEKSQKKQATESEEDSSEEEDGELLPVSSPQKGGSKSSKPEAPKADVLLTPVSKDKLKSTRRVQEGHKNSPKRSSRSLRRNIFAEGTDTAEPKPDVLVQSPSRESTASRKGRGRVEEARKEAGVSSTPQKQLRGSKQSSVTPPPRRSRGRPRKSELGSSRSVPAEPKQVSPPPSKPPRETAEQKQDPPVAGAKSWNLRTRPRVENKPISAKTSIPTKPIATTPKARTPMRICNDSGSVMTPKRILDMSVYDFSDDDSAPPPKRRKLGETTPKWNRSPAVVRRQEEEDVSDSSYEESSPSSSSESSESSEEEPVSTKTRGRQKAVNARSRRASKKKDSPVKATPKKRAKKQDVTLNIPDRSSRKKGRKSKLDSARERLHPSAVPHSLPCREEEFEIIYDFVEEKLLSCRGGCMYISGLPGTGKTATVMEVISSLQETVADGDLPPFDFVEVNGMRLTDPKQAFVFILEQLTGEKKSPEAARMALNAYFSNKKTSTVLFADELDLLSTRKQEVLYDMTSWPFASNSQLVLLGVANTMNLPDRISENKKLSSRMGNSRVTFAPYTHQQLHTILSARVCDLKLFEPDVIELAVRKVAALSGDIRRALDLLIRAIEIARASGQKVVQIPHLQQAIGEMFSSSMMRAIRNCSLYQKLFLRALLAEFQRSGVEEALFFQIIEHMPSLYALDGVKPIPPSLVSQLCIGLCASKILLVDNPARDLHRKIRLNLPPNDLKLALAS